MDHKPNYYAIIPAKVRYANIKANSKLLYGEITALSNQKGYCWSTNNYFANLYGVSKNTISLWINELRKKGFVSVEVIRNENKQVVKRKISIIQIDDRGIAPNDEDNKQENNNTINILSLRKMKFGSEVSDESMGILSVDQANEFLDYWTETNKSETKMRFEIERTWNTRKRLLRWKKMGTKYNSKSFNSKSKINNAHNEWLKAKEFIKQHK